MDRFRRWIGTAVALALLTSLAVTPVMAKGRTITGRGIEQPDEGPGLDATGEPDTGSGGLPRIGQVLDMLFNLRVRVLLGAVPLSYAELDAGSARDVRAVGTHQRRRPLGYE